MTTVDSNRFNQILIVDSIPAGDLNTARRLFDDLRIYASAYTPSPAVTYVRVENSDELTGCIRGCRQHVLAKDVMPLLHIECHGDEDGFMLADGSRADWVELKQPITELNIAMRLNLMITVAACTGGALAKVVSTTDRAPFWGLIGPTRPLAAQEIEKAYRDFFLTLIEKKLPAEAIEALDRSLKPGSFFRTTSQGLFDRVCALYKKNYCTDTALDMRAQRMRAEIERRSIKPVPTLNELKDCLVREEPSALERFRRTYFMCDLFPEHFSRFSVKHVEYI